MDKKQEILAELAKEAASVAKQIEVAVADISTIPGEMDKEWDKFAMLVSALVDKRDGMKTIHISALQGKSDGRSNESPTCDRRFTEALDELMKGVDQMTGEPQADHLKEITGIFADLPRAERSQVKAKLSWEMVTSLRDDEMTKAQAFMAVNQAINEVRVRRASSKVQ